MKNSAAVAIEARPVRPPSATPAEDSTKVVTVDVPQTEPQQVAMEAPGLTMPVTVAFAVVELAARERGGVVRRRQHGPDLRQRDVGELRHELGAPLLHPRGQFGHVVGEEEERRGGGELLPLEQHGRLRAEQ